MKREQIEQFNFNGQAIPEHMIDGILRYINNRIPNGSFLTHIFENDFVHAAAHADTINMDCLPVYAAFLYNEAPLGCWGSREKVTQWLKEPAEATNV